jgi:hypothetical protein
MFVLVQSILCSQLWRTRNNVSVDICWGRTILIKIAKQCGYPQQKMSLFFKNKSIIIHCALIVYIVCFHISSVDGDWSFRVRNERLAYIKYIIIQRFGLKFGLASFRMGLDVTFGPMMMMMMMMDRCCSSSFCCCFFAVVFS